MHSKKVIPVNFAKNGTAHVKNGKKTVFYNIQDRDYVRQGVKHAGQIRHGHHVEVTPGQSIRLFGKRDAIVEGQLAEIPYNLTFKVGDNAVYDAYNLVYVGTILNVTAKGVTLESEYTRKRITLHEFSWRNEDFNLEKINAANHETLKTI